MLLIIFKLLATLYNVGEETKRKDDHPLSKHKKNSDQKKIESKISIKSIFKSIGPGVITDAANDDPSGIATYSQAGASFG